MKEFLPKPKGYLIATLILFLLAGIAVVGIMVSFPFIDASAPGSGFAMMIIFVYQLALVAVVCGALVAGILVTWAIWFMCGLIRYLMRNKHKPKEEEVEDESTETH